MVSLKKNLKESNILFQRISLIWEMRKYRTKEKLSTSQHIKSLVIKFKDLKKIGFLWSVKLRNLALCDRIHKCFFYWISFDFIDDLFWKLAFHSFSLLSSGSWYACVSFSAFLPVEGCYGFPQFLSTTNNVISTDVQFSFFLFHI